MFCVWKFNGLIRKEGRLGGREVTKNGVWLLCQLYYCDFVCLFLPGIKKKDTCRTHCCPIIIITCPVSVSPIRHCLPPSRITSSRFTFSRFTLKRL